MTVQVNRKKPVDCQDLLPVELWGKVAKYCDPPILGRVCRLFSELVGDIACTFRREEEWGITFVIKRKPACRALISATLLSHLRMTCLKFLSRPIRLTYTDLIEAHQKTATFDQWLKVATAQAKVGLPEARVHFEHARFYNYVKSKRPTYWLHLDNLRHYIKTGEMFFPRPLPRLDWEDVMIASAQAEGGLWDDALQLIDGMQSESSKDQAWEELTSIAAKAGDFKRARKFAGNIQEDKVRIQTLCALAAILRNQGHTDDASQTFELAITQAYDTDTKSDKVPFLLGIGCELIKAGDVDRVLLLLGILKLYGLNSVVHQSHSFLNLIKELAKANFPQEALKCFQRIEKKIETDSYNMKSARIEIALAYVRAKKSDLMLALFKEIDGSLYSQDRDRLIRALLDAGDFSIAKSIISASPPHKYWTGNSWACDRFGWVAAAEANAGAFNQALFTASRIIFPPTQAIAYSEIAAAYIRLKGAIESGCSLFDQAITLAQNSPHALKEIARLQAKVGLVEEAKTNFFLASSALSPNSRSETWGGIISIFEAELKCDFLDSARQTVEKMRTLPPLKRAAYEYPKALALIAKAEANRGRPLKALEKAGEIPVIRDYIDALRSIATDSYQLAPDSPLQQCAVQLHRSPMGSTTHCDLPSHRFLTTEPDV